MFCFFFVVVVVVVGFFLFFVGFFLVFFFVCLCHILMFVFYALFVKRIAHVFGNALYKGCMYACMYVIVLF